MARVTFCKHFTVAGEQLIGATGVGTEGRLRRFRPVGHCALMFGHVFRSGHAFCYHILCMFARLKCCFSARATYSLFATDLTRVPSQ